MLIQSKNKYWEIYFLNAQFHVHCSISFIFCFYKSVSKLYYSKSQLQKLNLKDPNLLKVFIGFFLIMHYYCESVNSHFPFTT